MKLQMQMRSPENDYRLPTITMTNETPQPIFEIPDTAKSRAFVARNPKFPAALVKLLQVSNKCFGRNPHDKDHREYICFWLGHTSRQDFLEVVFLAINGYGSGATKILRSLYERAVTIEYLIQNPAKVDRFLQFAAIQENRAMENALKQVPQDQIDAEMAPENSIAEIRKRYEQYKGNFKATACSVCGVKTPPLGTWTSSPWFNESVNLTRKCSFLRIQVLTSQSTPRLLPRIHPMKTRRRRTLKQR